MRRVSREGGVVFCRLNSWGAPECVCECESVHSPPWVDPVTVMGCGFVCEDCLVSVSQHQLKRIGRGKTCAQKLAQVMQKDRVGK